MKNETTKKDGVGDKMNAPVGFEEKKDCRKMYSKDCKRCRGTGCIHLNSGDPPEECDCWDRFQPDEIEEPNA